MGVVWLAGVAPFAKRAEKGQRSSRNTAPVAGLGAAMADAATEKRAAIPAARAAAVVLLQELGAPLGSSIIIAYCPMLRQALFQFVKRYGMSQDSNRAGDRTPSGEPTPAKPVGLLSWLFSRKRVIAALPAGVRVYAVGDIHGRLDLLEQMQDMIVKDSATTSGERVIVYLGDYVDRGPASKGVIDRLLMGAPDGFQVRFIRGNHDQSMLDFLEDPVLYRMWKNFGAQETLMSYGVRPPLLDDEDAFATARDKFERTLPESHLVFLNKLEYSTEIGDYFFTHAGVRPGLPLAMQAPEDLMWIREDFLTSNTNFGKVVVHGHTPTEAPVRRPNRIGVDTGAYATGHLTCAVLEAEACRFLRT